MKKVYFTLMLAAACSMSQHPAAASPTSTIPKEESCTPEEAKAQAGMNTIFGGIRSKRYVDSTGKPIPSKPSRKCPPSKAEQDAGMRTIYGKVHSPAYVKGPQTK